MRSKPRERSSGSTIGAAGKQKGGTLSGGEQHMLALARARKARPRLICMDEPTMGPSSLFVGQVLERPPAAQALAHSSSMQTYLIAWRKYVYVMWSLPSGVCRIDG